MSWVEAIKKYSEITGQKFAIPKRESPEYAKIKAIQDKMGKGEEVDKLPRAKQTKVKQVVNPEPAPLEQAPTVVKPVVSEVQPVAVEAPVKKQKKVKVAKAELVKEVIPVVKKEIKKRVMKSENAVIVKEEPVWVVVAKEEKKPRQKKIPKVDNKVKIVEVPKGPVVVEKAEIPKEVKESREAKQKAKQERLETQVSQSIKAGENALKQTRMIMKSGPYILDFA